MEQIIAANVIVLSTPVYYYSVCAQLKMMIDRTLPLGAGSGKTGGKEFYFITTAAAPSAMECTMADLQGFVDCVPGSVLKGKVYGQAFGVGEIKGKAVMAEAYNYGKKC